MAGKHVVGWHVMATMPEELNTMALQRALCAQSSTSALVVYSDRGGQYCGNSYQKLPHDHEAVRSQSRRGNYYDNAHAESFWSRFKAELFDGGSFPGLAEAKLKISHHVACYNAERRHSALGY